MKFLLFLAVFVFGSFFVAQKLLAANMDIIINEIGSYATSTHEWIEVWNKGSSDVDLGSWKFWENNTSHGLKAVSMTDSIISPNEYAIICQDGDVFLRDYPNFIGSVLDSAWSSLSEGGEEIGLKDETGNFIEKFTYVSTNQFSLERKDPLQVDYTVANWQEHTSSNTVGFQNSNFIVLNSSSFSTSSTTTPTSTDNISTSTFDSTSTSSVTTTLESATSTIISDLFDWIFIKLNEIVSYPADGNERVEIYNSSSSSMEISGASICDGTGTNCKPFSGTIFAHDWLVVDLLTDRYLNNDGDSVVLKDENGDTVDSISYGNENMNAPQDGESLIRKFDGVDSDNNSDWTITTDITLDAANHLVAPVVVNTPSGNTSNSSVSSGNTYVSTNTVSSSIKTNTTTAKSVVDPIKISWKLDWPYGLGVGEIGTFDARGTADPRGGDIGLVWNFGDSATGTGFIVSHSYATSGVYIVSVSGSSTASTTGKKDFKVYVGNDFSFSQNQVKIGGYLVDASSTDDEFIELVNFSTSSRNISFWKIKNKSGKEYEIPQNTNISASGTLKFFRSITHLSFDKDGDEIIFSSPSDKEVDKIVLLNNKITKKESNKSDKKEVKTLKTASVGNWKAVQGVVTALPGVFGSQYFYISVEEKGYQVYQYKKDFPNLKIGDKVVVRGELSEISGVSRIKVSGRSGISILGEDKSFEPLTLEDLVSEAVGALVKISGDITSVKSNYFYVDNSNSEIMVYLRSGAKIDKQDFKLGDSVEVVGILEQTKSGLRVSPRDSYDIKVIGYSDQVLSQQIQTDIDAERDIKEKYFTATAGGLSTLLLGFLAKYRGIIVVNGAKKVVNVASRIIKRG